LKRDPNERLRLPEIKAHPFFASIRWESIENKQVEPEFVPDVQGEDDIHNIDPEFTDEVPEETLQASNHLGQRNNSKIDQFTYAPDNYL